MQPEHPSLSMTRRRRWLMYGSGICVIAAAQIVFLATTLSPYPDVHQSPAETNRVMHPMGFSIVKPGRTRAAVEPASSVADDRITIVPDGGRSRYKPMLCVRLLRQPPEHSQQERDGFQPGEFQGQDALICKGASGKYDAYRVMTERGGVWYEIALLLPGGDSPAGSMPSPEWLRYLETFAPANAPAATTRPSTRGT